MDFLFDIVIYAIFQWYQVGAGTLFIGYPSNVRVLEVCVEQTYCFTPTNKVVDEVQWDGPIEEVTILVEDSTGNTYRERLVWSPAAIG